MIESGSVTEKIAAREMREISPRLAREGISRESRAGVLRERLSV